MNELLELKTRLNQISITGLKSISNDFRLKKIHEKIQLMAKRSSVFSKIEKLISQLYENYDFKIFSELVNLINAVLSVQSTSYENKSKSELDINNVSSNNNYLKFSQLNEVRKILEGSSSSTWSKLKDLYKENKLNDYRIFDDLMKLINSTYTYTGYESKNDKFNIVTIFSNYDERIIPILLKKFETSDNASKSNIVKIISNIGKQKYNDYYIKWINEEENENVVANSIKALVYDKSNFEFLLSLKPTKKKLKRARAYTLAYIPSVQAHNEFKDYCIKDKEFLDEFLDDIIESKDKENISFLSENEIVEILKQCTDTIKDKLSKNKDATISKEFDDLYTAIKSTFYYKSDTMVEALIDVVESQVELQKFQESNNDKKAVTALLKFGTQKAYKYLASIKNKFKDDYYCALSFIAAIKSGYTKEKIFDEFSPLCKKESFNHLDKSVYDFLIGILYFYEYKTNNIGFFNFSVYGLIKLDINNPIEWDKRWLQYTIDNNLIEVSALFIDKTTDNILELKQYYINYIQSLKKVNIKAKYNNHQMHIAMIMSSIILGLFKTGAKKEAIENLVFICSCSYYKYIIDLYIKYLSIDDIDLLENLKWNNKYSKIAIHQQWNFEYLIKNLIYGLKDSANINTK